METTTVKVVGPRDGKAGFLGSIGSSSSATCTHSLRSPPAS
jgi:hypothetical protein